MKNFSKLMLAGAVLVSTMSAGVAAQAMEQRRGYDGRYERQGSYDRNYRSDRDRRDGDRRHDRRDRDRGSDGRERDRRGYERNGTDADVARRNYELERDMQTCYRNGRRICPN
jgi:hypothetical protein